MSVEWDENWPDPSELDEEDLDRFMAQRKGAGARKCDCDLAPFPHLVASPDNAESMVVHFVPTRSGDVVVLRLTGEK